MLHSLTPALVSTASLASAAFLVSPAAPGALASDQPAYHPAVGSLLEKRVSVEWSTELESSTSLYEEQEFDSKTSAETTSESFTLVVRDEYIEQEAGVAVPTRTLRTYVELAGLYDYDYRELAEGGEAFQLRLHHQTPLEEQTHELRFHADVGDWERRPHEEANAALLATPWEGSEEDLEFRFLLPEAAVEPGAEWALDPERFARFALLLEHELGFRPVLEHEEAGLLPLTEDESERADDGPDYEVEGGARARWEGVRTEEERRLGVLALEVELVVGQGWSQTDEEGDVFESASSRRIDLEGEALWDLEGGHLHGLLLEGELLVDDYFAIEAGQGAQRRRTETREHSPGSLRLSVATARRER